MIGSVPMRPVFRHYVTTPCAIPGHPLGTARDGVSRLERHTVCILKAPGQGPLGGRAPELGQGGGLLRAWRLHNTGTVSHTRSAWAPPALLVTPVHDLPRPRRPSLQMRYHAGTSKVSRPSVTRLRPSLLHSKPLAVKGVIFNRDISVMVNLGISFRLAPPFTVPFPSCLVLVREPPFVDSSGNRLKWSLTGCLRIDSEGYRKLYRA